MASAAPHVVGQATASIPSPADLVPSLRSHNASFLSLLSLIPPQFYLSPFEDDQKEEKMLNSKFMKNIKRERKATAAAAQVAEEKKEKKKRKLDPRIVAKTVMDVQEERRKKEEEKDEQALFSLDVKGMDDEDEDAEDSSGDADSQKDTQKTPSWSDKATSFGRGLSIHGLSQIQSDNITALRQRLADKIADLQSHRGGSGPSSANAIAPNGAAGDGDEESKAEDDCSTFSIDPDGSVVSTRDELLEERRRKRGEMRDRRRRERKELRRQAATQAATVAAASAAPSSTRGNQTKNGSTTPSICKGGKLSAPSLLVPDGGTNSRQDPAQAASIDGSDIAFSTFQFAGDEEGRMKKRDRNALPSHPKQALEVLQARKKRETERKAARGDEGSEGEAVDDVGPSSSSSAAKLDDAAAWSKALSAAKGVKIRDDERLLRRAIKRKEKLKTKSSVEWKERQRDMERKQREQQQRRQENLTQRKEIKKAKKMGKKLPTEKSKKKKTGGAPGGGKRTKDRKLGSRSGKPSGKAGGDGGGRAGFEGKKFGAGGRKGGK